VSVYIHVDSPLPVYPRATIDFWREYCLVTWLMLP